MICSSSLSSDSVVPGLDLLGGNSLEDLPCDSLELDLCEPES